MTSPNYIVNGDVETASAVLTAASYAALVNSLSPLAYYKLNEAAGTSVADSSGNGRTGTLSGAVTYHDLSMTNDGDFGMGFLKANSTSVNCGTGGGTFQIASGSLSMLIRGTVANGTANAVLAIVWSNTVESLGFYQNATTGVLQIWTGSAYVSTGVSLIDGAPHMVTMTSQSGVANGTLVYVDGVLVLTTTKTSDGAGCSLYIGGVPIGSYYSGTIDEVALFGSILTPDQIWNLYRTAVLPVGTSHGYHMDPFNSLAGWVSTGGSSVSANILTMPTGASSPQLSPDGFCQNVTWRMRFQAQGNEVHRMKLVFDVQNFFYAAFDMSSGSCDLLNDVNGSVTTLNSASTVAKTPGTWYWADFVTSYASGTWTLAARVYADNSGTMGAQLQSASATSATHVGGLFGSLQLAKSGTSTGVIGGLSNGRGLIIAGPGPSGGYQHKSTGWVNSSKTAEWFGYLTDSTETGGQTVLAQYATAGSTPDNTTTFLPATVINPISNMVGSLRARRISGTGTATATFTLYNSSGTSLGTVVVTCNPADALWHQYQATAAGFATAATAKLDITGISAGALWYFDQMQLETGTTATAYRDSSVRILSGETVTPTDTTARTFAAIRPLTAAAAIATTMARIFAAIRPLTATSATADAPSRMVAFIRPKTLALNVVEAVSPSFAVFRKITEHFGTATNMNRGATFTRPVTQALGIADIPSRILTLTRAAIAALGATEALQSSFGTTRRIADQVGATGLITRIVRYAKLPIFTIKDRSAN